MPSVPTEVIVEQYLLKASFFSMKIDEQGLERIFENTGSTIKMMSSKLDWSIKESIGITEDAFKAVKNSGAVIGIYFCHPSILHANPRTLKYYRCISVFSQKGLRAVSKVSKVDRIELGGTLTTDEAKTLAQAINRNLSLIYESGSAVEKKLETLLLTTAGSSIEGSWRNAIGGEGERVIKTLLLKQLYSNGELKAVIDRDGTTIESSELSNSYIEKNTQTFFTAIMVNGSQLNFSSEPDITARKPDGSISAGVEVKAGLDPAAALERLGAMLKSFENLLSEEPSADTILIASCITDEVQRRINSLRSVTRAMILTDITLDRAKSKSKFINMIRASLMLVDGRL